VSVFRPLPVETALGITRSLSGRRWVWRAPVADRVGLGIAQRLDVPEVVGRVLAGRGITVDAAADFLAPTLRALMPDPSCMADMDAAAERLADAVLRGETVAVFGDYDVDGACSAALMTRLLRALGVTVFTHIPDRLTEGYGPNAAALRALVGRGASLIVCVDCGTAAIEPLSAVAGRADVIVLDHHKAEGPTPPIAATVNPNRLDCVSRLNGLCAAGVAFLTAVAAVRALRRRDFFAARTEPDLLSLLDLVALATVCDVMPLIGLNRALVTQGLRVMARRARPGVAALLDVAGVRGEPDAFACGYALGPRINAAGRLSEAGLGLRLLLTEDEDEARMIASQLDAMNGERRTVEAAMLDAAMEAAALQASQGHACLLVSGPAWHQGVVGIVAGRIKERFNRPALVAGIADGVAKGSGRSVAGLDLGAAVIAARQAGLLMTGGGHAMAAGFSLDPARLPMLHDFLNDRLAPAVLLPGAADLAIEGAVTVAGAGLDLAAHLARLAPFGPGNEEPVFALTRARVVRADRVGKDGTTVRAMLEGEGGGVRLKAMLFRAADTPLVAALLSPSAPLHIAGSLRHEVWQGRASASLCIADVAEVPPA
jgi:single-stranded-DNA-specific exonuclease